METAATHRPQDDPRTRRQHDRDPGAADQLPRMPHPGPGLLSRPRSLGRRRSPPAGLSWVAPCPVGSEEINRRKDKRQRKSRMDARTRERVPVLPTLRRTVDRRRRDAAEVLDAARNTAIGQTFTAAGRTLRRIDSPRAAAVKVWAQDVGTGARHDLAKQEEHAFWTYAAIEVLRATGIRIEELTELSHHSLVQYRLPTTGEIVPLLQIAPSKTDAERLLVVSPELAEVLSAVIRRVRDTNGAIPLVATYDHHERVWLPPLPLLFQRRRGCEHRAISASAIRSMLDAAIAATGLTEPATGQPLRFTPHDFRRLFITDAVLNGLPPHIAQVIAGHPPINVTMGYKAVYPDEAIQSHLAFLARRRDLRPTDEYRVPTDEEWQKIPRPLRTPQGLHRHLRTRLLQQLRSRARLRQMPAPSTRPRPTAPATRDPRQPDRPNRRSRARGLVWRG